MFRIKICGVTSTENARQVADAGADAIGLNFYPASKRFVAAEVAREITESLPSTVARVGVFVNATAAEIRATVERVRLDFVQLHGDESAEFAVGLASEGLAVIRAFRCSMQTLAGPLEWLAEFQTGQAQLAGILIDAQHGHEYGGTGVRADWSVVDPLRAAARGVPLVLAGGLQPDNVSDAIHTVRPDAVDTASGVETSPGQKDPDQVRRFVAAARAAFESP